MCVLTCFKWISTRSALGELRCHFVQPHVLQMGKLDWAPYGTVCHLKQVVEPGLLPIRWWGFIHQPHFPILLSAEKRKINIHKAHILYQRVAVAIPRPAVSQMSALTQGATRDSLVLREQMREKTRISGCRELDERPNTVRDHVSGGTSGRPWGLGQSEAERLEFWISVPVLPSISCEFSFLGLSLLHQMRKIKWPHCMEADKSEDPGLNPAFATYKWFIFGQFASPLKPQLTREAVIPGMI